MVVNDLNLIFIIYLSIGFLIGLLMIWVPKRPHQNGLYRVGLFFAMLIGWFPLAIVSWIIIPFIKGCSFFTRL